MDDRTVPDGYTLVEREAGRVVVLDQGDDVLLCQGRDVGRPDAGTWWFTPGGGIDPGEDVEGAARRELFEETGLEVGELGEAVALRHASFAFEDMWFEQDSTFFVARVSGTRPHVAARHLTEWEERNLLGMRWWGQQELRTTAATVFPPWLADLLTAILHGGPVPHDTEDDASFHAAAITAARARLAERGATGR